MQVVTYNSESQTLVVDFPTYPRYEVYDLPLAVYEAMCQASSPQKYFYEHIWGNKFEHCTHWPDLESLLHYMGEAMSFDPPVSVSTRQGDGDTPLHTVCVWGDTRAIELLVAGGADINARGDLDTTPIYNAVSFGRVRSVKLLLSAGATVDDENRLSTSACASALASANPELVALFSREA